MPPENPSEPCDGAPTLHLEVAISALGVRSALSRATAWMRGRSIPAPSVGAAELVLAEALNNICRHAFPNDGVGRIGLDMREEEGIVRIELRDGGQPMPGGVAPAGAPAIVDCALDDMPEGGFGWFLIRQLTEDLVYSRDGNENRLSFSIRSA